MPCGKPARCQKARNGFREIIRLAVPASLETVFQTSLGLVDQVIVGFLGASAVAAVGLSNSVSFVIMLAYSAVGTATWGLLIVAFVQPAKVLNSVLGNGILPSGGDTKFVLLSHVIASYLVGLPCAVLSGLFMGLNLWGVYGSRCAEETIKLIFFLARFRFFDWHRKSEEGSLLVQ